MKSFINDLYDHDYTGEQAVNNEEESGDDEEINIKLKGEGNATNENNEKCYRNRLSAFISNSTWFEKKMFFINNFPKISQ